MKTKIFSLILLAGFVLTLAFLPSCNDEEIEVPDASTVADFTYVADNGFMAPSTVNFTNKSLRATSYNWDFGNGQTSTEENPAVTYDQPGSYTVTLTVGVMNDVYYNEPVKTSTIIIKDPLAGKTRKFYFTDRSANQVKYFTVGEEPPLVQAFGHTGLVKAYGMVIDTLNERVYVSDFSSDIIYSYDMDGFDLQTVVDANTDPYIAGPVGMFIYQDKLYWAQEGGIYRCNLDGSSSEEWILTPTSGAPEMPLDMVFDPENEQIYFTNDKYEFSGGVYRVNLDGSGMIELVSGTDGGGLAIDFVNGKMYYADYLKGICMADLDGNNEVIIAGDMISNFAWGMEVDVENGKVYWGDRANDRLVRANLDGSGQEDFITGVDPDAMILDKYR